MKKEIEEVTGSTPLKDLNNDIIKRLPYLDSVLKETLRIDPPVPNILIRVA